MISREEIEKLAELARLKLTDAEAKALQKDISAILEYVGQVSTVEGSEGNARSALLNILRSDIMHPVDSLLVGKRDALLQALPKREGDYAVVRKIIQRDE